MGFDASNAIEPLAYSGMSEWGIPDGTIPEPTAGAFEAFVAVARDLAATTEGTDATIIDETDLTKRLYEATSALCSGVITADQLAGLPVRLFRAFIQWLLSEFTDPKG